MKRLHQLKHVQNEQRSHNFPEMICQSLAKCFTARDSANVDGRAAGFSRFSGTPGERIDLEITSFIQRSREEKKLEVSLRCQNISPVGKKPCDKDVLRSK